MWILGQKLKKLFVCKNQKGVEDKLPLEEPIRLRISKKVKGWMGLKGLTG